MYGGSAGFIPPIDKGLFDFAGFGVGHPIVGMCQIVAIVVASAAPIGGRCSPETGRHGMKAVEGTTHRIGVVYSRNISAFPRRVGNQVEMND